MEQHDIVKMLQGYGFTDLRLISFEPDTNTSNYKFGDCNTKKLHVLGEASVTSNGKVAVYKVGSAGKLGYCPSKNLVRFIFKGESRENKLSIDGKGQRIPTPKEVEQAFYKAQANNGLEKAFVLRVWHWANTHYFSGKLKEPQIFVGTTCPFNSKLSKARGVFSYSRGTGLGKMFVHSINFKSTEQITVGTIVHEMCHQATHEISNISVKDSMVDGGHGPVWQQWMHHCNLEPNRYDMEDNSEYGDVLERIAKDERLSKSIGPKVKPDTFKGMKHVAKPLPAGRIFNFDYKGHLARGVIVSKDTPPQVRVIDAKGYTIFRLTPKEEADATFYLSPTQDINLP